MHKTTSVSLTRMTCLILEAVSLARTRISSMRCTEFSPARRADSKQRVTSTRLTTVRPAVFQRTTNSLQQLTPLPFFSKLQNCCPTVLPDINIDENHLHQDLQLDLSTIHITLLRNTACKTAYDVVRCWIRFDNQTKDVRIACFGSRWW